MKYTKLLWAAGILGFAYCLLVILNAQQPGLFLFPGRFVLKMFPVVALAVWLQANAQGRMARLVTLGLGFGALGDLLLDLHNTVPELGGVTPGTYFMAGLGVFLVGHVFYTAAFIPRASYRGGQLLGAAAMLAAGAGAYLFLKDDLPNSMKGPLVGYMAVISLMAVSAVLQTRGDNRLWMGALLFLISDFLIAYNTFVHADSLTWAPGLIMLTYYGAQAFITSGTYGASPKRVAA